MKYTIIGNVADVYSGYAFSSKDLSDDKSGIPVIKIGNLVGKTVDYSSTQFVQESKLPLNSSKFFLDDKDVLIAMTGQGSVGRVCQLRKKNDTDKLILNQRVGKFVVNHKKEDRDFLFYLLSSSNYQKILFNAGSGSGQPNLSPSIIRDIPIPDIDLITQKKIASILSSLDDRIDNNTRINKNLLQQARALYQSWFVEYEPFNGNRPADWIDGAIDDLAKEIICGKTPSTKTSEYYGNDIPFITIPDMHGNTYAVTTERYLSSYGAESQRKKTLPHNSICVSCIGTAGLVTLTAQESQTNQQINSIIPKEGYSPYYIYLLMETLSAIINNLGQSGSTIVNLNKAQFGKISVIIPTVATMKSFDKIVGPFFESILLNQKESIKLAELRDTLLPRLISGELDISGLDL